VRKTHREILVKIILKQYIKKKMKQYLKNNKKNIFIIYLKNIKIKKKIFKKFFFFFLYLIKNKPQTPFWFNKKRQPSCKYGFSKIRQVECANRKAGRVGGNYEACRNSFLHLKGEPCTLLILDSFYFSKRKKYRKKNIEWWSWRTSAFYIPCSVFLPYCLFFEW